MVRLSILAISALATCLPSTFAHPANTIRNIERFGCGTEPSEAFLNKTREISRQEKSRFSSKSKASFGAAAKNLTIQTYFHVVARDKTVAGGYVPQASLDKQLSVLNDNFGKSSTRSWSLLKLILDIAPHGVHFDLKGIDWTVNAKWAVDANGNELAMKKALRKGPYKALNVYFLYDLGDNLGYCYFPTDAAKGSEDFWIDGCAIQFSTVPGGSLANFNQGKTTTHEVGHWFGLQHTFEGGCDGLGDEMADTPAQDTSSQGCPVGRDSCPDREGLDPIHNYMDYSYE